MKKKVSSPVNHFDLIPSGQASACGTPMACMEHCCNCYQMHDRRVQSMLTMKILKANSHGLLANSPTADVFRCVSLSGVRTVRSRKGQKMLSAPPK
jgi:hypothetical protein